MSTAEATEPLCANGCGRPASSLYRKLGICSPCYQHKVRTEGSALRARMVERGRRSDAWKADAACRGMGPDIFFADKSETAKCEQARKVCERCLVSAECRAYGVTESEGRWGGLMADTLQRKAKRRAS